MAQFAPYQQTLGGRSQPVQRASQAKAPQRKMPAAEALLLFLHPQQVRYTWSRPLPLLCAPV